MFCHAMLHKKDFIYIYIYAQSWYLYRFATVAHDSNLTFSLFIIYSHISMLCHYALVFSCMYKISHMYLTWNQVDSKHVYNYKFTYCITLDMLYILLIVLFGFLERK